MDIKIAICDDEIEIGFQLENILIQLNNDESHNFVIDVFYSGEELCDELNRTDYDLIFLDIQMPGKDGVEVGRYIREIRKDEITQIAYISSEQGYAMELFDSRPINFLIKPLDKEKVQKVIDAYVKVNCERGSLYRYRIGRTFHKIEVSRIKYFVRNSRKVKMYTIDGCEEYYDSLEKIYEQVKKYGFLFIHKSYMVNPRYIKNIRYDYIVMTDEMQFSISQSRRKEIRDMYISMNMNMEER